jgi:tRNA threonylcarbamoyl adenosine modification protein (Sua5/YciO/YrdC/YwlC family)
MLLEINPKNPEPRKIRRAVDALEDGGVIAYPTDTVYGLGCDLFNKKAVDRLYQIKGMERSQMLAFVCRDLGEVARYAVVHNDVYRMLKRFLPGPYCFILEVTHEVQPVRSVERRDGK